MNKFKKIVPFYAIIPIVLALIFQFGAYYIPTILNPLLYNHNIMLSVDYKIPLIKPFVLVYFLCYISWGVNYYLAARESRAHCYKCFSADMVAKFIALIVFIVFPTTMFQPQIVGNGVFNFLMRFLYAVDEPINLLPSLHCVVSWFSFRFLIGCKKVPMWYKCFSFILALIVFATVLLVRQHCVLDVVTGVLLAELSFPLSKIIKNKKIYICINNKLKI